MLGTNVIVVFPGSESAGGVEQKNMPTLTAEDSNAIGEECDAVLASSPLVGTQGQVIYGNSNWSPRDTFGVGEDYLIVRNWQVHRGNFFTKRDVTAAAKVCVIGHKLVEKLFQTTNPVDETIRIKNIPFRVVGVLEKRANMVGDDQDDVVLMPYTTVRKRLQGSGFDDVNAIMVSARSLEQMDEATQQVKDLLADRHRVALGDKSDFVVQNTTEIANVLGIITGTLTMMLAAIAGISLIVGGVGIINIMLVLVTERTREIGIRMAVGARGRDILRQFLVESVLLSSIGGVFGIALGIGASTGITLLINSLTTGTHWPIVVSLPAAGLAMSVCRGVDFLRLLSAVLSQPLGSHSVLRDGLCSGKDAKEESRKK